MSWNGGGAWSVSLSAPTWSHPRTDSPLEPDEPGVGSRPEDHVQGRTAASPPGAALPRHAPQFSRVPGSTTAFRDGEDGGNGQWASQIKFWRSMARRLLADLTKPYSEHEGLGREQPHPPEIGTVASLASHRNLRPRQRLSAAHAQGRELQHRRSVSSNTDNQPTLISTGACFRQRGARCQSLPELLPRPTRPPQETWAGALAVMSTDNTPSRHFFQRAPVKRQRERSTTRG